ATIIIRDEDLVEIRRCRRQDRAVLADRVGRELPQHGVLARKPAPCLLGMSMNDGSVAATRRGISSLICFLVPRASSARSASSGGLLLPSRGTPKGAASESSVRNG